MKTLLPLLCLCATAGEPQELLTVHPAGTPDRVKVELKLSADHELLPVAGSARAVSFDEASRWLRLAVESKDGSAGPAMFGSYEVSRQRLVFQPRYPLIPGVDYVAEAVADDGSTLRHRYRIRKKSPANAPRVTAVYPGSDVLPANCLKFYVHFSRPMREGWAIFDRIQMVDARGEVLPDCWRRTEIWNRDATRLTLWVHPGRIKQGVNLREDFGPVLKPGRNYRLVVTKDVRDIDGTPLEDRFVKSFRAVDEDHERPDPARWKLSQPQAGTREPLRVQFPEPLDRSQLRRMLTVRSGGREVSGSVSIRDDETGWTFKPDDTWGEPAPVLHIHPELEDLAGNTPTRLFDADLSRPQTDTPELKRRVRLKSAPAN